MAQGKTYTDFGRPLEQAVFQSTSKYLKIGKSAPMENTTDNPSKMGFHKSSSDQQNTYQQTGNVNCCMKKACWWSPSQDSLPVDFCHSSSIHGLSFIGRPKTHLTEKIFWTIGFILGALGAVILINNVWQRHYKNPVIVSFQAQEVETDTIPFPSVTICNMNAFPKSKVRLFEQLARGTGPMAKTAKEYLKYVRSICNAQRSFAEEFKFASRRGINGHPAWNFTIPEDSQDEMMDFLLDHTIPCNHLIRLCMLGEKKADCEQIFKPVITDYGKCCTFNILPLPLLMRNPKTVARKRGDDMSNPELHPALGKTRRWSKEEIESWRLWNYGVDGFSVPNKSLPQPFRQRRAGMPYGLSILVDANLDDWYCPVSDAEGFRFLLHNPLEIPHIDEFASVLDLNKEIFIEVHPEVTNADDDIRDIQLKDRDCYFPKEKQLKFFQPYTGGNCIDECTAIAFRERCNCTQFYMPRGNNTNICNMDPGSDDYECINEAKHALLETMKTECGYCYPLCEDVEYHFETTMSTLQESKTLWLDPDPEHEKEPEWGKNRMSIMHIFLGSDTVVPKYRKRLYGTTDLIANTGGLLGLCLGVSVLSAVEVIYYLTLRAFWKLCWKRRLRAKRLATKFIRTFYRRKPSHMAERVIQLDVNQIPVFPQPPLQTFPRTFLKNSIDCERYVNGIRVNSFQNGLEEKSIMFKTKIA